MSHFISAFLLLFFFSLNISHSYGIELFSKAFDEDSEFRMESDDVRERIQIFKEQKNYKKVAFYKLNYDLFDLKEESFDVGESIKDPFSKSIIILNLFNDVKLVAYRDHVDERGPNDFSWMGHVLNQQGSIVAIVIKDDKMAANIHTSEGEIYSVSWMGNGIHGVASYKENNQTLNDAVIPPIGEPTPPSNPDTDADGTFIDVAVFYTSDAASGLNIATDAQADIDATNIALANSCVDYRYRLVNTASISYTETGNMSTDLNALRTDGDSLMDSVHTTRDSKGADLVALYTKDGGDYCGLAYVNSSSSYAFSITDVDCAYETFAHELGHNMGLNHDRYQNDEAKVDPTATRISGFGWVSIAQRYRTIMSYSTECTAMGVSCPRVAYFSNPRVYYKGENMGIHNSIDSASVLNARRKTVASFKTAQSSYTPTISGCLEDRAEVSGIGKCFIATAAFGSPLSPYVNQFRKFRDKVLLRFSWGAEVVNWYYLNSPSFAKFIEGDRFLKIVSLTVLMPLALIIQSPLLFLTSLGIILVAIILYRKKEAI